MDQCVRGRSARFRVTGMHCMPSTRMEPQAVALAAAVSLAHPMWCVVQALGAARSVAWRRCRCHWACTFRRARQPCWQRPTGGRLRLLRSRGVLVGGAFGVFVLRLILAAAWTRPRLKLMPCVSKRSPKPTAFSKQAELDGQTVCWRISPTG